MTRRLTTDEFIKKAKAAHGDQYDYSQVEYETSQVKVTIICPEHGPFQQAPNSHLNGHGCDDCGGTATLTSEKFIAKARIVHGDSYDYSLTEYVNGTTKVTIICRMHGSFQQLPSNHIHRKVGCENCGGSKRHTKESFVRKSSDVHGHRYDYSLVEYKNNRTAVTIKCADHGPFHQTPHDHLAGKGCGRCGKTKPLDTEIFIERAVEVHGDRYDYSQTVYTGYFTKLKIICPVPGHGTFEQLPRNHINQESGCPKCGDYGFNPNNPAEVYYLAVETDDGDTRYKIGITNRTVEERFRAPDLARIRIVKTWQYPIGQDAVRHESEILSKYAGDKYTGPNILQTGNTELFTHDILEMDV